MKSDPRRTPSRWTAPAVLTILGLLFAGCSVIEVIDNIGQDDTPPPAKAEPADALPDVPDGSNQAKLRAYYNRRPKEIEEDPNDPIVSCRLSGTTQFMRKNDCELRGGQAKS